MIFFYNMPAGGALPLVVSEFAGYLLFQQFRIAGCWSEESDCMPARSSMVVPDIQTSRGYFIKMINLIG